MCLKDKEVCSKREDKSASEGKFRCVLREKPEEKEKGERAATVDSKYPAHLPLHFRFPLTKTTSFHHEASAGADWPWKRIWASPGGRMGAHDGCDPWRYPAPFSPRIGNACFSGAETTREVPRHTVSGLDERWRST